MKVIVVSAANSPYFKLLQGWAASIRDKPESDRLSLGVLDVGLKAEELRELDAGGIRVEKPGWDFDLGLQQGAAEHYKAQVARPFLPKYFPDFDAYIWMDADTWVQRWWVFDLLLQAVQAGAMAIVPELDRAYPARDTELRVERALGIPYRITSYAYRRYLDIYGKETAWRCFDLPVLNAGVFALAADAPHWEVWRREYQRALFRSKRHGLDQISLGYLRAHQIVPFEFLPATCNWLVHLARPAFDPARGLLVEPYIPHQEIAVIHTTMRTKAAVFEIAKLGGGTLSATLHYPGDNGFGHG